MARSAGEARPNPTEKTPGLLAAFYLGGVSGRPLLGFLFSECVIARFLGIIHSRFGDGPGWGVAKSGVRPRQATLELRLGLPSLCSRRPGKPAGRGP
jgi:hypothetical protein